MCNSPYLYTHHVSYRGISIEGTETIPSFCTTPEMSVHKTGHSPRNNLSFVPFVTTYIAKSSFYYQGAVIGNSLHNCLYSSRTFFAFKTQEVLNLTIYYYTTQYSCTNSLGCITS